ncbi:mono-ADP-ribosylating toxin [Yersinia phage YerA41]|nr:mono-ADP-ribosylating toxin [Yersinia phage YerA41]
MPEVLYHVSPSSNTESILRDGLILNSDNTSVYHELGGIYLTSDPKDLMSSGAIPEFWDHDKLTIFKIDVSSYDLVRDPEFDDYGNDDYYAMVCHSNIDPKHISLFMNVEATERRGTSKYYSEVK